MTLFTVGYQGLDVGSFLSLLAESAIETVVDVRELPLSHKRGFSKKGLAEALTRSGRTYIHMVGLGCPRSVRHRYREDGDWPRYARDFLKHLKTNPEAVSELSDLASSSRCALLCYEADASRCHRSMVAEAVRARTGAAIKHITAVASGSAPRRASI